MSSNLPTVQDAQKFGQLLRSSRLQSQIKAALPKNVSLDRFTTTTQIAINHNLDLLKADQQSLFNAIVKCAADGLLPDGNDAVLNIYKTNTGTKEKPVWTPKVQYQRMVGGIIKQFTKAGINAYAVSVYQADKFKLWNDNDGQHVEHMPVTFGERGPMVGVLAVAKLQNELSVIETMNIDDVERARASSKSGESGPWKTWYDRMAQKSVLHRLRRRVAIVDDEAAAELNRIDDEFEDLDVDTETGEIRNVTPASTVGKENQDAEEKPQKGRPKALQNVVDSEDTGSGDGPNESDVV